MKFDKFWRHFASVKSTWKLLRNILSDFSSQKPMWVCNICVQVENCYIVKSQHCDPAALSFWYAEKISSVWKSSNLSQGLFGANSSWLGICAPSSVWSGPRLWQQIIITSIQDSITVFETVRRLNGKCTSWPKHMCFYWCLTTSSRTVYFYWRGTAI